MLAFPQTQLRKPGSFMSLCRETVKMAVPPGNRRGSLRDACHPGVRAGSAYQNSTRRDVRTRVAAAFSEAGDGLTIADSKVFGVREGK